MVEARMRGSTVHAVLGWVHHPTWGYSGSGGALPGELSPSLADPTDTIPVVDAAAEGAVDDVLNKAVEEALAEDARRAIWSESHSLAIADMLTMEQIAGRSMARTSFALVMLAIAGGMALLLGIIGIYGVVSYTVAQRRREVGIYLALGARPAPSAK